MNQRVTELHLHDHYSFMDGLNTPEEYMVRASELGMTHLAQTNHGSLSGHRAFQRAAQTAGITPILGVEAYISSTDMYDRRSKASRQDGTDVYNHIILLAQDETGLQTLNRLSEKAWTEGFYNKPRIDIPLLLNDNEGLIVLSGCLNGLLSKAIERGDAFQAMQYAKLFKEGLGDRFYVEVQGHNPPEINYALFDIADKVGIKPVTTSDCHYARQEDLYLEEAMLILSTNPKRNPSWDSSKAQKMELLERYNYLFPDRRMTFQEIEIFLRSYEQHAELYAKQGIGRIDMIENTNEVASRIGEYPYYQGLDILPRPDGDPDKILRKMVFDGLRKRGVGTSKPHLDRAEHELEIISGKKFSPYFILLEKVVSIADRLKIRRGPGRGSAAGSVVVWSLGATDADPLDHGLIFSRFIDPGRDDWPDVDMDFDDSRRDEIVAELQKEYEHVAAIATFQTFKGKSAIRDAGKVVGVPIAETAKALKDNDAPLDADYIEFFLASERGKAYAKKYPDAIKVAKGLTGRIRNGGRHPAAVVVSSIPLSEVAPIQTATNPNDKSGPRLPYIALDHEEVADIGGIKMDLLSLKNLRVIEDTLRSIRERHGVAIEPLTIPMDDANVYKMLAQGHTHAVFQADGGTFTQWILKNKCDNFMDLVLGTAISRPGALNTVGEIYRKRLFGEETVHYQNDIIYEITKDTLGCIVFQEQVMKAITDLAGMSSSDANKIRKIIGKKRDVSEFEQYKAAFVEGASKHIKQKDAEHLWHDFEAHAGYSFNLSHAVVYSMVTYWTAWLKYYYPLEYMAAVLLAEKDMTSVTGHLIEIKRLGIPVYLPHINYSAAGAEIQDDGIRLGLSQIKYVSAGISKNIIKYRPYKSYAEFSAKAMEKYSGMNSRMLDSLNKVGAADFDDNPTTGEERANYYEYMGIPAFSYDNLPPHALTVMRKVVDYDEEETFATIAVVSEIKRGNGWSKIDFLDETGEATAFAGQDTPLEKGKMYAMLLAQNSIIKYIPAEEMSEDAGMLCKYLYGTIEPPPENKERVVAFKPRKTKAGKDMGTLVVMDENEKLHTIMVWPSVYGKVFPYMTDDKIVDLECRETDDGTVFLHEMRTKHGY